MVHFQQQVHLSSVQRDLLLTHSLLTIHSVDGSSISLDRIDHDYMQEAVKIFITSQCE